MHKAQSQVAEFHREVVNGPVSPQEPQIRQGTLRANLILEEAFETVFALVGAGTAQVLIQEQLLKVLRDASVKGKGNVDLIEAIDGLCDLLYVAYGTAEAIGVDLEPFYDEVHRSNMAKKGGQARGNDGKWLKPEGWTPPDIAGVLRHQPLVQTEQADDYSCCGSKEAHEEWYRQKFGDDESKCAWCGWPVKERVEDGCIRGNCSMRPMPEPRFPERAHREVAAFFSESVVSK